jgi:DNA adenine methylase
MATKAARPFLKWAGGKTQLLPPIAAILPRTMRTYYEPFIGGGAVFFHVSTICRFERAVLNDWNRDLIDTYRVIRDFSEDLIRALNGHLSNEWNTAEYFADMRAKKPAEMDPISRAARIIYLNKTCFNGLMRMNKSGQFNVPFGKYKNPSLFDEVNLRACAETLNKGVTLLTGDFTKALPDAGPRDVVYFDPPYVPLSATSNFASYTSDGFGLNDQRRLAFCFKNLVTRGVTCILSNSDTELVRQLYEDFEIIPVQAKRHINSKGDGRGNVGEVIVVGRPVAPQVTQPALTP